jgi:hypothetical protein
MAYKLQDDLSFCQVGGHLIFLDIREDRYFRLPPSLERAFISYAKGDPAPDVGSLIEQGILRDSPSTESSGQEPTIRSPNRSALEQASAAPGIRPSLVLEVSAAIVSVLLRLKTCHLKNVLASMTRYRRRRTSLAATCLACEQEAQLVDMARAFNRARLYTPVKPSCLLDSIALSEFLARRRIHATVVLGVTGNPFAAHSWVQVGDLVLNDTVGNANSYVPIRAF